MTTKIVLVDYGMGNLWSVQNAFLYLGVSPVISSDPTVINKADTLILPGVGSFYLASNHLKETGVGQAILQSVVLNKAKFLGICLGMQLLCLESSEDGESKGLGVIPTIVERISNRGNNFKVPHIGFNSVDAKDDQILYKGLKLPTDFYFVHSYKLKYKEIEGSIGTTLYGEQFISSYENKNIFATQFHPEKSQTNGLKLLQNFLNA